MVSNDSQLLPAVSEAAVSTGHSCALSRQARNLGDSGGTVNGFEVLISEPQQRTRHKKREQQKEEGARGVGLRPLARGNRFCVGNHGGWEFRICTARAMRSDRDQLEKVIHDLAQRTGFPGSPMICSADRLTRVDYRARAEAALSGG